MNNNMEKRPTRVCLIVDNPLRDLDGLVLVGWHLALKNVEVFLVSMSSMYEVYFLKPDLVLLNYVRKANKKFIKRCEQLGIKVGVLDTEGGILKDVDFFFSSIFKHINSIDLYCLWGLKQFEALRKVDVLSDESLKVTGCPRYDFCVYPWNDALPVIPFSSEKMVLVNTNFPLIQPRFQSPEREAKDLVSVVGFDKEYVSALVSQTRHARNEVVDTIKRIAPRFPEFVFVIRPHPFEDKNFYEYSFKSFPNVEIHQSEAVFPWINRSIALLHYNCSTAVEAVLMGKEPIHLGWIKTPLLEQPTVVKISQQPQSIDGLEDMLSKISSGQQFEVSENKKAARKKVIRNWFYSNDGKNSERVADAILNTIFKDKINMQSKQSLVKIMIIEPILQKDLKSFFKHILILTFGSGVYSSIKGLIYKKGKEFNVADVNLILNRLRKVINASKIVIPKSSINKQKYIRYSIRLG